MYLKHFTRAPQQNFLSTLLFHSFFVLLYCANITAPEEKICFCSWESCVLEGSCNFNIFQNSICSKTSSALYIFMMAVHSALKVDLMWYLFVEYFEAYYRTKTLSLLLCCYSLLLCALHSSVLLHRGRKMHIVGLLKLCMQCSIGYC